ncbi:MAG: divalent metal cation transporter [Sphingomonadales bacterium]|nr:divalent metal cation transporter [Sphingomonadales bacterium]
MADITKHTKKSSVLISAAFLMATSAIGPGFLTQTASFTNTLLASFGFVILISILLDIGAQLTIWKVLCAGGMRAQVMANKVIPGAGYVLTSLIVLGGLAFNTGNLAGAGLGLEVLTGWSPKWGAAISAAIALLIFLRKDSLQWMDAFTRVLGLLMIALTVYVVFKASPPLSEALQRTFVPATIDLTAIITLVGGTVGGYISFAGAHRLLDAGLIGKENTAAVGRSAISAILLASVMRVLLFLAALGVVAKGISLGTTNPAAAVFKEAAGAIGYKLFGIVMWCAAITSVVGSAYTSISFLRYNERAETEKSNQKWLVGFVILSLVIFLIWGKPVTVLLLAGAINGFILPVALGIILLAAGQKKIMGDYQHNKWLTLLGVLVLIATLYLSIATLCKLVN